MSTHIDRLVAQRVMGWEEYHGHGQGGTGIDEPCYWYPSRYASEDWNPSTSIAHAFEALEHWRGQGDGRWYEIWSPYDKEPDGFQVGLHEGTTVRSNSIGDTAPIAICRALLLACGVTDEEMGEPSDPQAPSAGS